MAAALHLAPPALAQDTIKIPNIIELSGAGATVGNNWKNGSSLAVDEINAAGGILGKKIQLEFVDTALRPRQGARRHPARARRQAGRHLRADLFRLASARRCSSPTRRRCRRSSAARPPTSPRRAPNTSSAPPSARTCRCRRSPTTCATRSRPSRWRSSTSTTTSAKAAATPSSRSWRAAASRWSADLSTEAGQADFAADVIKLKGANADAVFVYLNEEESARFLIEAKKQGLDKPLIGETTLLGQKVIDLAKDAANGVKGHVGLTVDAPIPAIQEFGKKFEAKFNYKPDHNGVKGYIAPYMIKAAAEKAGKLDAKAIAAALHGLTITPDKVPGILIEATWDETGEIDRISLPRRGQGRQAGHHPDAAEAEASELPTAASACSAASAPRRAHAGWSAAGCERSACRRPA